MIEASQNPDLVASELLRYAKRGYMPVFDIDGVLFDATHRQATLPDGSLNLEKYRELATPENIAKDRPLPLIGAAHALNVAGVDYLVCTARLLCDGTRKLLADHGVKPVHIFGRTGEDGRKDYILKVEALKTIKRPPILVDDNLANLEAIAGIGGMGIHIPFCGH